MIDVFEVAELSLPLDGEWWECGVHKGRSSVRFAKLIADSGRPRVLRLFDSFEGHPVPGREDGANRAPGTPGLSFANTSPALIRVTLEDVEGASSFVSIHRGEIPRSFAGLEYSRIAFAYLDLDLYAGTRAALKFVLPRLVPGGSVVVDDYSAKGQWPGVSLAVDEVLPDVQRIGNRAVLYQMPQRKVA